MVDLTVRMSAEAHTALAQVAHEERRSMSAQIGYMVEQALVLRKVLCTMEDAPFLGMGTEQQITNMVLIELEKLRPDLFDCDVPPPVWL